MKKIIVLCLFVCTYGVLKAQVNWVYNMKDAQIKSLTEHKLILMDFWASWCRPCREMDDKLWNSPEISKVTDKFIPMKVDIDIQKELAVKYGVKAIPTVILMTATGDVIWQKTDFSSASAYLKILEALPNDIEIINSALAPIMRKEASIETFIEVGKAFQETGITLTNKTLSGAFLRWSNTYYKRAKKKGGSKTLIQQTELLSVLNDAYRGNIKKVRKKLAKLKVDEESVELKELTQFIRAYCYKCEGDQAKVDKMKAQLNTEAYIAQLEQ